MWCQIHINYNKKYAQNQKTIIFAGKILRSILVSLKTIYKRAFYLFEMSMAEPHNFVAFELKYSTDCDTVERMCYFFESQLVGKEIHSVTLKKDTSDWSNGEYFLKTICAHCESLSKNYNTFFKQQRARKNGLNGLHHLIHCMMNATFGNREMEIELYNKMAKLYRVPGSTIRAKK